MSPHSKDRKDALFRFAPNAIEDLGVNLYTSVGKALVEFVASAWDAYSPQIEIDFDSFKIDQARQRCKHLYETELKEAGDNAGDVVPLEIRCLEPDLAIVIKDLGDGMDRNEIEDKFLVVGRRRRTEKNDESAPVHEPPRLLMGRKGLGKLAGFGIAHRMTVTSRKIGMDYSTRIVMDYDDLLKIAPAEGGVPVPTTILKGADGLAEHGTRIELTKLVYQTLSSDPERKLESIIARNFGLIREEDYKILINGSVIRPEKKDYQWAYPVDAGRALEALIPERYSDDETGKKFTFRYRFRFTEETKYLSAAERGVRVYAHNRLAALPSMLGLGTSPRGFRFADYLDGVIDADFIDDLPVDLVATDRSNLRWDVPPLAGFQKFMGEKLTKALADFAVYRDDRVNREFNEDEFTKTVIGQSTLPAHRKSIAKKFAKALSKAEEGGVKSPSYKNTLTEIVEALNSGDILTAINKLTDMESPEFPGLVRELTRLTQREFGDFMRFVNIRLKAIESLRKLVEAPDFRGKNNEAELHLLFRDNPWLINPQYFEWLTSNKSLSTLAGRLEQHLKVGKQAAGRPAEMNTTRPDLVSVIANESLRKVVIIELKATNIPLDLDHLQQLIDYIYAVKGFLKNLNDGESDGYVVEGYLIGTMPTDKDRGKAKCMQLINRIDESKGANPGWRVVDVLTVLKETERVHRDFVDLQKELTVTALEEGED